MLCRSSLVSAIVSATACSAAPAIPVGSPAAIGPVETTVEGSATEGVEDAGRLALKVRRLGCQTSGANHVVLVFSMANLGDEPLGLTIPKLPTAWEDDDSDFDVAFENAVGPRTDPDSTTVGAVTKCGAGLRYFFAIEPRDVLFRSIILNTSQLGRGQEAALRFSWIQFDPHDRSARWRVDSCWNVRLDVRNRECSVVAHQEVKCDAPRTLVHVDTTDAVAPVDAMEGR